MSARARALAEQFEQINANVIAAVEALDERSPTRSSGESWPLPFTARHIAESYQGIAGIAGAIAAGQEPPPVTAAMIDDLNAAELAAHGDVSKAEALAALRERGDAVAGMLRGFSDEQLDRSAPLALLNGATVSVQQFIEMALFGHTQGHLQSIQQSVQATA